VILKALEASMEATQGHWPDPWNPHPDVPAGTSDERPTFTQRRADALATIAESFLKHGPEALTGGERQQIIVHVDEATLRNRASGRCEIEDGPSIAAETARRLACDASVVEIVEDERGDPLDIGRRTRTIPPAIRRALQSRDRGCRFPGCPNQRYVDGHHIRHWINGGETKLSNLVTLCHFHHRQVHEGGIRIDILDDGALRFAKPGGVTFEAPLLCGTAEELIEAHEALEIDDHTAATRWQGERIDYSIAIEGLLYRAARARGVPAGTRAWVASSAPTQTWLQPARLATD